MVLDQFSLKGKTAIVTGGCGLMGRMIKETIEELEGTAICLDIKPQTFGDAYCDITSFGSVLKIYQLLRTDKQINVDILINNAVGNQKATNKPFDDYDQDLAIGLTGAVNTIQIFGPELRERRGVVLNMGSDLSLIGPDQSLYPNGLKKPLSYSVVKAGIVGMTRYFATLWPEVRCNCLCPGGIDVGQKTPHVPMGRLARLEEMKGPVAFLISNASSYMTGAVLSVDGGRTAW